MLIPLHIADTYPDFAQLLLQTPGTGLDSIDKPLIDMATPQAEPHTGNQFRERKRLTEAFESPPASKKSRLSVVSGVNETGSPMDDGDGTDSLLIADEVGMMEYIL